MAESIAPVHPADYRGGEAQAERIERDERIPALAIGFSGYVDLHYVSLADAQAADEWRDPVADPPPPRQRVIVYGSLQNPDGPRSQSMAFWSKAVRYIKTDKGGRKKHTECWWYGEGWMALVGSPAVLRWRPLHPDPQNVPPLKTVITSPKMESHACEETDPVAAVFGP